MTLKQKLHLGIEFMESQVCAWLFCYLLTLLKKMNYENSYYTKEF